MDGLTDKSLRAIGRDVLVEIGSDVALLLEADGTIVDVQVNSETLRGHISEQWLGRRWHDTVTSESIGKIDELLTNGAHDDRVWRQVNHPTRDGDPDLPVRYRTLNLGRGKQLLGIGHDLSPLANLQQQLMSAQRAAEQDYWQLRQAESKYRLLFQTTLEAILVVDAERMVIEEANNAALQQLGWEQAPENRLLTSLFSKEQEAALQKLFAKAAANGHSDTDGLSLKHTKGTFNATITLLRQGNTASFILQLRPEATASAGPHRAGGGAAAAAFYDAMPDAFVIADSSGVIRFANAAFADLAALPNRDQAIGAPLNTWLGRTDVDLNVLLSNLREHGQIRYFQTLLRSTHDLTSEVEVSAARLGGTSDSAADSSFGFVVRDSGGRPRSRGGEVASSRSIEELTELVGRVPLKDLVRESSDLIERFSIEAALKLTQNNRAAAADMLGLSRQSLYVKMRRFDIGDKRSSEH